MALKFYIVSEQKMNGGRYIDTPDLPKVGYIAAKPDLIITNIQDVWRQKVADYAIMNGKPVPSHARPTLAIKLHPEEGKLFSALTEQALRKRLLVTLGDRPLCAPVVVVPIDQGNFSIEVRTEADLERTQDDLKRLVR